MNQRLPSADGSGAPAASAVPNRITPLQWLSLAALLAVALGLRLYKIETESIWFDECITYQSLKDAGPMEFFMAEAYYDPATVPVYFGSAYVWYNLGFTSVVAMRCLSVLASMLGIVVLYFFGRRLFGHMGGMTAALCMSLAKVQIYMAQEIRNYAFTSLFAAIAMYALYEAVRTNRKHLWAINIVANGLLCLTHFLAATLLFAEGVFLLVTRPRKIVWTGAWASAHVPFLLFIPFWIWMVTADNMEEQTKWIDFVWLGKAFSGYYFVFAGSLMDAMDTVKTLPSGIPVHHILGVAMLFAGAAFVAYCAWVWWQQSEPAPGYTVLSCTFLLIWLFVPPATLFVLARLVVPVYIERYVLFSALALFLIAGGTVAALPRKQWQVAALALLALVYAGNLVDCARPLRLDYISTGKVLRDEYMSGEHVHTCIDFPEPPMEYYAGVPADAIVSNEDFPEKENPGDEDFVKRAVAEASSGSRTWLWFFDVPARWEHEKVEAYIAHTGVQSMKWEFVGRWRTYLYRLGPSA